MKQPQHPLWHLLYLIVLFGMLTAVMWYNASNFDKTELTALVQFAVLAGGMDAARYFVKKNRDDE